MQNQFDILDGVQGSGGWLIFPTDRDGIIELARKKHLPPDVIEGLQKIPDKVYNNIGEVVAAASKFSVGG